jgi:DNA polymerase III subunit gamma/tau
MDKFIVSARKYRPQNFSTVVGQSHITTTLRNAIKNNQLAHAFLFCGPRGVGKTTCARILAKTINCENPQKDGEACNACPSCISFNNGTSLNIHELDAASNNSVDDIRTLTDQVRFAPQAGKYKVYIIDEVHMLSSSAFNAFLKTLEEPPSYAIFILATTEKHKILPTILSRCQIFDFKRITVNDTVEHLQQIAEKEHIKADKGALQVIAQKSEGCMRDALSLLDKIVSFTNGELTYSSTLEHLNILDADYYFKLLEYMQGQDLAAAMLLYDDINRKGFEADMVINGFAEFLRNLMVCKDAKSASLLEVVEDFRDRYIATAKKLSLAYLISAINILTEAEINYKQARNKRLHAELTLIKLTYLQQAIQLSAEEGQLIKKKIVETVRPVAFRKIPIVEVRAKQSPPDSYRDPSHQSPVTSRQSVNNSSESLPDSKLFLETGNRKPETDNEKPKTINEKPTLGALQKIRQQIAKKHKTETEVTCLNEELLHQAWGLYIEKLHQQKNHSAVTNFKQARLKVTDENSFEIFTESNIQQKFIEQERAGLIDHIQQFFNNRQVSYQVILEEVLSNEVEKPLSMREQYLKMIEQYPLVKELKDRLNLDLDY